MARGPGPHSLAVAATEQTPHEASASPGASAGLYLLVQTTRANGLHSGRYLEWVFASTCVAPNLQNHDGRGHYRFANV